MPTFPTTPILLAAAVFSLNSCTTLPPAGGTAPEPPARPRLSVFGNSDEGAGVGIDLGGGPREPVPQPVVHKTGAVEFRGFTPETLQDFRIVPEEGLTLIPATNGIHERVDGFWWRHSREWFKIPNHCSVIVTADPAGPHASSFRTKSDCNEFGAKIQRLRGMPDRAGFYPDQGNTGHGTNYPW